MKNAPVSRNLVLRLPRYFRKLRELRENKIAQVSSMELGRMLGFTSSQIRQDLSHFGVFGVQGYGYPVDSLHDGIIKVIGFDRPMHAVLIGVGNVGHALLSNFPFAEYNITIDGAFDVNEVLIGTTFHDVLIQSMTDLDCFLVEKHIDIAILTVSAEMACPVADQIIAHGVWAIWNFTGKEVTDPYSNVLVENVNFVDSLLALVFYYTNQQREEHARAQRLERLGQRCEKRSQMPCAANL